MIHIAEKIYLLKKITQILKKQRKKLLMINNLLKD